MVFDKKKIYDYLDGKMSPFEAKQVEEWCRDVRNEELFYAWLDEWERGRLLYSADPEASLEKYQSLLDQAERSIDNVALPVTELRWIDKVGSLFQNRRLWAGAAVVVVLLITWVYFPHDRLLIREYHTGDHETSMLILADGSQVVLNANTRLEVPRFGFGGATRHVTLHGEALFSVASTQDKRKFVVKAGDMAEVVVLGTEFRVLARKDSTEIKLNHGKVQLLYRGARSSSVALDMVPGDHVVFNSSGSPTMKGKREEIAVPEWAIQKFRFEKTSLLEIVRLLSERFHLEVALADSKMEALSLSGTYEAHRGEELLAIIAEVLDLDVRSAHDKHILVSKSD